MSKATDKQDAEFQRALAELAGLDPATVVSGTLAVSVDRTADGPRARLTGEVVVDVDPDEVVRLAAKHNRLTPA